MKFSKPKEGKVTITYSQKMNATWHKTNGMLTFDSLQRVLKAGKLLGVKGFDVAGIIP